MSKTILQVNYSFTSSHEDYTKLVTPLAEPISAVPGLVWKVWLMNESDRQAGGIYFFETRQSANEFMNSQAIADFVSQPTITDVSAKMFEPDESLSQVTRGPINIQKSV